MNESPPRRLELEPLEDRNVPSVVVANFSTGLWRHNTDTGAWAHLSNQQANRIEVDDSGNVHALFSNIGLWRWSSQGWQKLSDAKVGEIRVTGGGVLYASLGVLGTWRWSNAGWQKLSASAADQMAVSDSDAFFGRYSQGTAGTWRWTPQAGWSKLTASLNETNLAHLQTDDAGNLVGVYRLTNTTYGLWRWNPAAGWKLLDNKAGFNYAVSELGQIYVTGYNQLAGTWLYDPSDPNPMFTKINTTGAPYLMPDPQGHLWSIEQNAGGATWTLRFYSVVAGSSVQKDDLTGFSDATVGKDGFLFLKLNNALYRYGPASGLLLLSGMNPGQIEAEGYDYSQAVNQA